MILVDANLLVYAYVRDFEQHHAARAWFDSALSGGSRVAIPWESSLAFVRLVTNPRVFSRPVPVAQAWTQIGQWLDAPTAWIPAPTPGHRGILSRMMAAVDRANDVPDAQLAALAVEHGLLLATSDRGFARFPGLRWENPLAD